MCTFFFSEFSLFQTIHIAVCVWEGFGLLGLFETVQSFYLVWPLESKNIMKGSGWKMCGCGVRFTLSPTIPTIQIFPFLCFGTFCCGRFDVTKLQTESALCAWIMSSATLSSSSSILTIYGFWCPFWTTPFGHSGKAKFHSTFFLEGRLRANFCFFSFFFLSQS